MNNILSGWQNKKDLHVWDDEDTANLYKCSWTKTFIVQKSFENDKARRKYYDDLYDKLIQTLPEEDLKEMQQRLGRISRIIQRDKYERNIIYTITRMANRLFAHDHQKRKQSYKNPSIDKQNHVPKETSFNEFRTNKKIEEIKQSRQIDNSQAIPGYYPTIEDVSKIPPIEMICYVGFELIKYDKFRGYYSAILKYPIISLKEERKVEIIYNENPLVLESEVEHKFNEEVDKYIQSKSTPYGNKTFNSVDISNIEQVMGGKNNETINPLDGDIF